MESIDINSIIVDEQENCDRGVDELEAGRLVRCPVCRSNETGFLSTQKESNSILMTCDHGHEWEIKVTEFEGWSFLKVEIL